MVYTYKDALYFVNYLITHREEVIGRKDIWALPNDPIEPEWIDTVKRRLNNTYGKHTILEIYGDAIRIYCNKKGQSNLLECAYINIRLKVFEQIVIGHKVKQFLKDNQ